MAALSPLLVLVLLPHTHAATGDTKTWDLWSSDPDSYPFGSRQQRYHLEGRIRFAAVKGDIIGFQEVLDKGKLMDPPLDINGRDKDGRSALHFLAQDGWGGDLMEANGTRIKPPADDPYLFGNPNFRWGVEEYKHTFLYQAFQLTKNYPEEIPEGVQDDYVFQLDWCNQPENTCPMLLNLDARDLGGTTAVMEAAIHNNPLTARTLIAMSAANGAPGGGLSPTGANTWETDEFCRNRPLNIEWGIGWGMYNWISLNGRDTVLSEVALDTADEFLNEALALVRDEPKGGLTNLDYAVMFNRSDIVNFLLSQQPGLLTAESNWGERPIHKAGYMGHAEVAKVLLKGPGDCGLLETLSLADESAVLLAAMGGHIKILEYFRATCPAQFTALSVQPATIAWQAQNPCDLITYSITKAREWCGDEMGCPGYYRWTCSNDRMQSCLYQEDCQRGDKTATCDEPPTKDQLPFSELVHHWKSCVIVCPPARRLTACGPSFDGSTYDGFNGL